MKKKKEYFKHQFKRMFGYLVYREQETYRYNLKDLMEYQKLQDIVLKDEDFSDLDATLMDRDNEL